MPDLLSHILFCLVACELINFKKKGLILLGAILPDIVTKWYLFGFIFNFPEEIVSAFILFHSLIPILLMAILIGLFFKDFYSATYLMGVGALSHLLLDLFNAHFLGGTLLLFPFSWNFYRINLFWGNQYQILLILLLVAYSSLIIYKLSNNEFLGRKNEKHL